MAQITLEFVEKLAPQLLEKSGGAPEGGASGSGVGGAYRQAHRGGAG